MNLSNLSPYAFGMGFGLILLAAPASASTLVGPPTITPSSLTNQQFQNSPDPINFTLSSTWQNTTSEREDKTIIYLVEEDETFPFPNPDLGTFTDKLWLDPGETKTSTITARISKRTIENASGADEDYDFLVTASATREAPEPLTIIASGLAVGIGALCQREYSKKRRKK